MSRKGESIFKRKDGRWEGRYIKDRDQNGRAIYGYVYGRTYGSTREKMHQVMAGIQISAKPAMEPVTAVMSFGALSERWLMERHVNVKESTYIKYRNLLNYYIIPQLGRVTAAQISVDTLNTFYAWLLSEGGRNKQGLSAKTVSDVFAVVRSVMRFAKIQEIPMKCTGSEVTVRSSHKELCILSIHEQNTLVEYLIAHPSNRNLGIILCLYTGMRLGELCALRWEDFSVRENTIYIHQTMQRLQIEGNPEKKTAIIVTPPKSLSSNRIIPIPPVLQPMLEDFRCEGGYILTDGENYVEPRTMENHFKRVLRQAMLPAVNFHCLRHTFATRCVEAGFDIKTLSEILGHSSITITMNRYVHPTMQMKRENMDRLSSLFLVR